MRRQSAVPKLNFVFFHNRRQNAERIASLHCQTEPLLQPKGLPTLSRCLGDTRATVVPPYTPAVSTVMESNLKRAPYKIWNMSKRLAKIKQMNIYWLLMHQ